MEDKLIITLDIDTQPALKKLDELKEKAEEVIKKVQEANNLICQTS